MPAIADFAQIDLIAVLFFFASWLVHYWVINHSPLRRKTITHTMNGFRRQWMHNMVRRELKMVDSMIQNTLQYGVLFFASTSIILVGALIAGLGASDQAVAIIKDLPFASPTSRLVWEVKILLVVFIFVFAFFKFAWSYRLFNYVIILLGAAPDRTIPDTYAQFSEQQLDQYVDKVALLHGLGARHFTTGLNAYFYALAAICWFVNAWLFVGATLWVSLVLYRRAFRSNFLRILRS